MYVSICSLDCESLTQTPRRPSICACETIPGTGSDIIYAYYRTADDINIGIGAILETAEMTYV